MSGSEADIRRSPLHVAAFQYAASDAGPLDRLAALGAALGARAGNTPLDLVVCPELFVSGYWRERVHLESVAGRQWPEIADALGDIARTYGVTLVVGTPAKDAGRLYNAAVCLDARGRVVARHHKLVLPNAVERANFSRGDRLHTIRVKGWTVGMAICYDAEFPETVRGLAQAGAEVIAVPTALTVEWEVVPDRVMPTRAFENGCYLVYANFTGAEAELRYRGHSRILGPDGSSLAAADTAPGMLEATLEYGAIVSARERLPYLVDFLGLQGLAVESVIADS